MSNGLAVAAGIVFIAGVTGLATVLVGRGLGARPLWLGWAAVWIVTIGFIGRVALEQAESADPVALLLATAAVVGIPTGVAARYADRRSAGTWDRPWWLDAIWSGAMFLVALPFAALAALALAWIRLLVVS